VKETPSKPFYRRRILLPLFILLLAALAGLTWFDNAVNRGITFIPTPPPVAWASVPQLGVNAYNIQFEPNPADVTRTLELARDMGARYVRMQLPWEDVEIHGKGDFEDRRNQPARNAWQKYDALFGEMRRLGLEPIVRIDRAPDWARQQTLATPEWQAGYAANPNSTGPPDRIADYADFVGVFAARYRNQVRFIQLWNEPNLAYEWNWRTPDPQAFVELLRAGAVAARAANPDAVMLFPSLAPTDGLDPQAPMTELEFLDQIYLAGGSPFFDIMSAQAYGLGQPPTEHRYVRVRRPAEWYWTRPLDTRIDVSRVVLLREVMERHGDGKKAVWISEFGYVSPSENVPAERRNTWGAPVTEAQKAAYLVGQLERARREWPWVGVMNVWFLRWGGYREPDPQDPTQYFALVRRDFTPLPAYEALKTYAAQEPAAGPGAHAWGHPAVHTKDANTWEIVFEGTSLALHRLNAPLSLSLDQTGPVNLHPAAGDGPVVVAEGLPDGRHTVEVHGAVPPEAFLVGRAPPLPWLWAPGFALLLSGLAATGGLIAAETLVRHE
jgi:hypothetical protein